MRLAIPVWDGRISPVLDVAREVLFVDLEQGKIQNRNTVYLGNKTPTERAEIFKENGVTEVLCGAVSEYFFRAINNRGIDVVPWVTGRVEDILNAFASGHITDPCFRMPGCHRHGQRACFRRKKRGLR